MMAGIDLAGQGDTALAPAAAAALGGLERGRVYYDAREIRELAKIALECVTPGRPQDMARAQAQMKRIAAISQGYLEACRD